MKLQPAPYRSRGLKNFVWTAIFVNGAVCVWLTNIECFFVAGPAIFVFLEAKSPHYTF